MLLTGNIPCAVYRPVGCLGTEWQQVPYCSTLGGVSNTLASLQRYRGHCPRTGWSHRQQKYPCCRHSTSGLQQRRRHGTVPEGTSSPFSSIAAAVPRGTKENSVSSPSPTSSSDDCRRDVPKQVRRTRIIREGNGTKQVSDWSKRMGRLRAGASSSHKQATTNWSEITAGRYDATSAGDVAGPNHTRLGTICTLLANYSQRRKVRQKTTHHIARHRRTVRHSTAQHNKHKSSPRNPTRHDTTHHRTTQDNRPRHNTRHDTTTQHNTPNKKITPHTTTRHNAGAHC